MLDAMAHRGPDGRGIEVFDPDLCLGAVRLAIVDPTGSGQPIRDTTGQLRLIYNGEVYNYRDLRADLAGRGHKFGTRGDGEVIMALYREDPRDFAKKLDGMFAFALWDGRRRRLTLGRDPCGIKPLYYAETAGGLVFGSELKALLAHPEVPLEIDPLAVRDYLRHRFAIPPRSAFAGVRKVPPGAVLIAEPGRTRIHRYWRPADFCHTAVDDGLDDLLASSISTTTGGLDRVAMFLSGGLDSSTAVALAARTAGRTVETFSVGYRHGGWEDERDHARAVADHLSVPNSDVVLSGGVVADVFTRAVWHLEEPAYPPVALSTFAVSGIAAQRHKVAISGDGVDELLLGYEHFRRAQQLADAGGAWEEYYWRATGWLDPEERGRLLADAAGAASAGDLSRLTGQFPGARRPLDGMRWFEFSAKLAEYHLSRVDRLAMAHSLEVRVPFLRNDVVRWALARPARQLLTAAAKQPLRDVAARLLPAVIVDRPKQKFSAPVGTWLAGPLHGLASDLLHAGAGAEELGLRRHGLRWLAGELDLDPTGHLAATWGTVMLLAWYSLVVERLRAMRARPAWAGDRDTLAVAASGGGHGRRRPGES